MAAESAATAAEAIRRAVAGEWGRVGAAWGVPPSTAMVQGYLLLHGGPLTESELHAALGISHRATRLALAECEGWGIVERAGGLRRAGARGPAGAAWIPVGDHWEWFRRVAGARKARETDPVLPLLADGLARARALDQLDPDARALTERVASLVAFATRFDRALDAVVRADSRALDTLFAVLDRLSDPQLDRLLDGLATLDEDALAKAAGTLADLSPIALRRLVGMAGQPGIGTVLGAALGRGKG
jgi:DNA-binding transcriptional regulator GbsR (MarR family)